MTPPANAVVVPPCNSSALAKERLPVGYLGWFEPRANRGGIQKIVFGLIQFAVVAKNSPN
jgi:hypothetical protein